jgi:hypothetical protein
VPVHSHSGPAPGHGPLASPPARATLWTRSDWVGIVTVESVEFPAYWWQMFHWHVTGESLSRPRPQQFLQEVTVAHWHPGRREKTRTVTIMTVTAATGNRPAAPGRSP